MTDRKPRFCLPFRISISLAFALITVPLLLAVIGTLYVRNVNLAREVAVDLIERATVDISEHVEALLVPLARVVDATTAFAKIEPDRLRKPETFQYLLTVLESTPHAEMLYVGFERDGAFFQVRRLHHEQKRAGASTEKLRRPTPISYCERSTPTQAPSRIPVPISPNGAKSSAASAGRHSTTREAARGISPREINRDYRFRMPTSSSAQVSQG